MERKPSAQAGISMISAECASEEERTNLFVAERVSRLAKTVTEAAIADGVAVSSGVLVGSNPKIGAV